MRAGVAIIRDAVDEQVISGTASRVCLLTCTVSAIRGKAADAEAGRPARAVNDGELREHERRCQHGKQKGAQRQHGGGLGRHRVRPAGQLSGKYALWFRCA
eukprot:5992365-Prymnesium_polylepis.1